MDIEKLIEQLNDFNENHIAVLCGSGQCACGYLCDKDDCIVVRAATALSTLQAENAEMQKQLNEFSEFLCRMTGGLLSKTNYTAQEMATVAEDYQQKVCGECDLQAENEKLCSDLRRLQTERDTLWAANQHLLAEREQLTAERDAAVSDVSAILAEVEEIRRGYGVDNADADNAFANLCGNYCAKCGNNCYEEAENYRCKNYEWRGQKED